MRSGRTKVKRRIYLRPKHMKNARYSIEACPNPVDSCHSALFIDNSPVAGFGVFAQATIKPGTFVCEYSGEFLDEDEAVFREDNVYSLNSDFYLFFVDYKRKTYAIDPTVGDETKWGKAKYINHSRLNPNCEVHRVIVNNRPHLAIISIRQIDEGEELKFDYGDTAVDCDWLRNT
ncbi:hypothetical protein PCE1_001784 [Barthelona sp. PCE]